MSAARLVRRGMDGDARSLTKQPALLLTCIAAAPLPAATTSMPVAATSQAS